MFLFVSKLYFLPLFVTFIIMLCFFITINKPARVLVPMLYYIVLYCIMRPYTEGQIDRYDIGIPRENPKSALNLG